MNVLDKINTIPMDVVLIIKDYIAVEDLLITNKKYYEKNIMTERFNIFKEGPINKRFYNITLDTYINRLIKNDLNYIFQLLIKHKYKHWIRLRNYKYNGHRFSNYIYFLEQLCITTNSNKCRNIVKNYEHDNSIVRKKHKKIKRINNRWTS